MTNAHPSPAMRIACVTETYPPEVNGVATTLARLVEGLRERHHDVRLVRPCQGDPGTAPDAGVQPLDGGDLLTRGWPIPRYPHLRLGAPSQGALLHAWSRRRPDVVHVATEGPLGWSALQAAAKLGLPVTTDFRTNFHAYSRHYGLGWLQRPITSYLRRFHNRAACTMVPTEALRRELAAAGFERLQVVARGVDTRRFDPTHRSASLRARWGARPGDPVMLYVGRLAAEKNLDALLRGWRAARAAQPALKLVLVGDGPLRASLQAQCPEACFAGSLGGHDLAAHYASADLFVFPSLTETFGNVTLEALASGLPVAAYAHAAAAQLVETGVHGLLAAPGHEDDFVAHAVRLAGDAPLRAAMAVAARRCAAEHDWGGIVRRVEHVLTGAARRAGDRTALVQDLREGLITGPKAA